MSSSETLAIPSGRTLLLALRAPFFTASVAPVLCGTAAAWRDGFDFSAGFFLLTLVGVVLLHAGANTANDYFDHKSGTDEINVERVAPFTGGSRLIQEGAIRPGHMLALSLALYAAGALIGLYLAWTRGMLILVLGLIGAAGGFFYTAPPFRLAGRALGEATVGLNFGLLAVLGSYYVQARGLGWTAFHTGVPVALLITAVLFINQFPDTASDAATGKRHIVARIGKKRSVRLYLLFTGLPYLYIAISATTGGLPLTSLGALAGAIPAVRAMRTATRFFDSSPQLTPALRDTIAAHALTGVLLAASLVIDRLI